MVLRLLTFKDVRGVLACLASPEAGQVLVELWDRAGSMAQSEEGATANAFEPLIVAN